MMQKLRLMICLGFLAGCVGSESTTTITPPTPDENSVAASTTTEAQDAVMVSFTAGESATLEVPEMSCPFACYPKVKETLESLDGITAVELVPQKEEGVIDDRRVTISFGGNVDGAAAVAALSDAGFAGSKFE